MHSDSHFFTRDSINELLQSMDIFKRHLLTLRKGDLARFIGSIVKSDDKGEWYRFIFKFQRIVGILFLIIHIPQIAVFYQFFIYSHWLNQPVKKLYAMGMFCR